MTEELIKAAATQGFYALLFVALLLYVLQSTDKREKASSKREEKYQETIKENQNIIGRLTETVSLKITVIEDDIKEIKNKI